MLTGAKGVLRELRFDFLITDNFFGRSNYRGYLKIFERIYI